jgi:hypothetical protein
VPEHFLRARSNFLLRIRVDREPRVVAVVSLPSLSSVPSGIVPTPPTNPSS